MRGATPDTGTSAVWNASWAPASPNAIPDDESGDDETDHGGPFEHPRPAIAGPLPLSACAAHALRGRPSIARLGRRGAPARRGGPRDRAVLARDRCWLTVTLHVRVVHAPALSLRRTVNEKVPASSRRRAGGGGVLPSPARPSTSGTTSRPTATTSSRCLRRAGMKVLLRGRTWVRCEAWLPQHTGAEAPIPFPSQAQGVLRSRPRGDRVVRAVVGWRGCRLRPRQPRPGVACRRRGQRFTVSRDARRGRRSHIM